MRIANLFQADVRYNYKTLVSKAFSLRAMLQKMKTLTSGGQKFMLLGAMSTYQEQFGQQRIELGSSFYVASAGRSDFTLF